MLLLNAMLLMSLQIKCIWAPLLFLPGCQDWEQLLLISGPSRGLLESLVQVKKKPETPYSVFCLLVHLFSQLLYLSLSECETFVQAAVNYSYSMSSHGRAWVVWHNFSHVSKKFYVTKLEGDTYYCIIRKLLQECDTGGKSSPRKPKQQSRYWHLL